MFDVPGILNPNRTANTDERVLTDARGEFEVAITEPLPASQGFPRVEVILSYDNGAEAERILHDKVGLLVQKRDIGRGLEQLFWGNRATASCGFLLRRGTYLLQAFVGGRLTAARQVVSQSDPAREDWEEFAFREGLYVQEDYADICVT